MAFGLSTVVVRIGLARSWRVNETGAFKTICFEEDISQFFLSASGPSNGRTQVPYRQRNTEGQVFNLDHPMGRWLAPKPEGYLTRPWPSTMDKPLNQESLV